MPENVLNIKDKEAIETENKEPIDILFVEDNDQDTKITLRAFSKGKIKNNIHVVVDGQEALDYIYHSGKYKNITDAPRPDLILLDIGLPKISGLDVLKKIKEDSSFKHIPVVMLTSSKNEQDIVKSYGYGAASYIPKPVSYEEFVKVVDGFNFYWHIINKLPRKVVGG